MIDAYRHPPVGLLHSSWIGRAAPWLLEVTRRVSPATHRRTLRIVGLCATPDPAEEGITVHFPQEWLRDPESPHLGDYTSDAPWDELALIGKQLGLRS
ncbi:MAG: hypothetical protein ACM3QY_08955 [Candidatus Levyibacteriota bacterium]